MDNKLNKTKKILILLGTIFNIISACCLLGVLALMLFSALKILVDIFVTITIVFFDLGLICYLSVLVIKVFFAKDNKVNVENLAFQKLLDDYDKGKLPEDVWRVVEYYKKTKNYGHLQFFAGLEIYKLNDTVEILIKILPLEISNNLYEAYQVFKGANGKYQSVSNNDEMDNIYSLYDEFFKSNTQKYENFIKYYVGIINDSKI